MGSINIAADDKQLIVCLPLFVDCITERHLVLKPLLAPLSVWEIDIEQGKRVESHDKNASLYIKSSMEACRNLHQLVARIYIHSTIALLFRLGPVTAVPINLSDLFTQLFGLRFRLLDTHDISLVRQHSLYKAFFLCRSKAVYITTDNFHRIQTL